MCGQAGGRLASAPYLLRYVFMKIFNYLPSKIRHGNFNTTDLAHDLYSYAMCIKQSKLMHPYHLIPITETKIILIRNFLIAG